MAATPADGLPKVGDRFEWPKSKIFVITERLSGGVGVVLTAKRLVWKQHKSQGPRYIAIKFEKRNRRDTNPREWWYMDHLQGLPFIPKVYYKGRYTAILPFDNSRQYTHNYVVMDQLGKCFRSRWFRDILSAPQTHQWKRQWLLEKAIDCIDMFEKIHDKGIVHADVKGENMVMGRAGTSKEDQIFLIDFGLSKKWSTRLSTQDPNPREEEHRLYEQDFGISYGTLIYESVHSHLGRSHTRRDDLESLAYCLIDLYYGHTLPWGSVTRENCSKYEENDNMNTSYKMCQIKMDTPPCKLVADERCPFRQFYQCVVDYKFNEKPDYMLLKSLFNNYLVNPRADITTLIRPPNPQGYRNMRFVLNKAQCQWVVTFTKTPGKQEENVFAFGLDPSCWSEFQNSVKGYYSDNLFATNAVYHDRHYSVVFQKHSRTVQGVVLKLSNKTAIDRLITQKYIITTASIDDVGGEGVVFMMRNTGKDKKQRYWDSDCFPHTWICDNWRQGYSITHIACSHHAKRWFVVMGEEKRLKDQRLEMDFTYPSEGIRYRWQQGYQITATTGNKDVCLFVVSLYKNKAHLKQQEVVRTEKFANAVGIDLDGDTHKPVRGEKHVSSLCFGRTIN